MTDSLIHTFGALEQISGANHLNPLQTIALLDRWVTRPSLWSAGGTDLVVGDTAGLVLTATRLPAKGATTVSIGSPGNNTWYYVYAYTSSGAIAYEVSTTAPDAYLRYKTGDSTRVYVGCFRTDGSATVLPFRSHRGEYVWRPSAYASNFTLVLVSGAATSFTDVLVAVGGSGTPLLPPHARLTRVRVKFKNNRGSDNTYSLKTKGDSAGGEHAYILPNATTSFDALTIETDSAWKLQYMIADATSSTLDLWTEGFLEPVSG